MGRVTCDHDVFYVSADAQLARELPLDDERTCAYDAVLVKVLNHDDLVDVLKAWEHLAKALRELFFCSVANMGQPFQRLQISLLKITDLQPPELELVVTCLF